MSYLVPTQTGCVQVHGELQDVSDYVHRCLVVEPYACAHNVLEDDELCWTCTSMRRVVIPGAVGLVYMCDCLDGDDLLAEYVDHLPWWISSQWFVYAQGSGTRLFTLSMSDRTFHVFPHGHHPAKREEAAARMKRDLRPALRSFEDNLKHWR